MRIRAVLGRQMFLDQHSHVGERGELHDLGDDDWPRQPLRPGWMRHGCKSYAMLTVKNCELSPPAPKALVHRPRWESGSPGPVAILR
jgi:hypothetical protein